MSFNVGRCKIPNTWCGNGEPPVDHDYYKYTGKGNANECRNKRFGAGYWKAKLEGLPANSLQRIRYVGPHFESRFIAKRVRNTDALLKKARAMTKSGFEKWLTDVCQTENGQLAGRTYNMVLLWIYRNGSVNCKNIPACVLLK